MSITGFPHGPPTRSGQSISDYYAGMLCAFSIVSALHYRQRTGQGQRIDMITRLLTPRARAART